MDQKREVEVMYKLINSLEYELRMKMKEKGMV